jgi:DNA-binding transcriptional LysR family regulator
MLHGRLLRYLDEVARLGSIRKAPASLNVAASAINRHIIELEDEIGAPIFERLPRGLRLTTSGELLIAHIRETLRGHDRTLTQIHALKGLNRGRVSIATMGTLAGGLLSEVIVAFRELHPNIRLDITILGRPELVAAVATAQAHLGVGYDLPHDARLQRASEFTHQLGAVVAPNHPLARRASVRLSECLSYPLVVAQHSLTTLRDIVDGLVPANAELNAMVETNSTELMKLLASNSPHVTFLNSADVGQEVREGTLRFLPLRGSTGGQVLSIVHRARGSLEPAASMFIQFLEARLKSPDGKGVLQSGRWPLFK